MNSEFLLFAIVGPLVVFSLECAFAENSPDFTEAKLQWDRHNFGIINGTGTAKIILTDFDAPNLPDHIDTVTVFVYSDSFPEGIDLELYETEKNSGIFERTFSLSETRSAPNILRVMEGDTGTVTYLDDTLPLDHEFSEIHLMETTLIGLTGPPLERVLASNARIVNLDGNQIISPVIDEQILLVSDIVSQENNPQKFVWLAQTVDSQNNVQSLSWINGTINPQSSFSPSTSWIPQDTGEYRTVFFVWESLDNPSALSPPVEIEFTVVTQRPVVYSQPFGYSDDAKKYDIDPIYVENPNTGEMVLDIDSMQQVLEIFKSCVNDSSQERMANPQRYTNDTHVILNLDCKWRPIGELSLIHI